MRTVNQGAIRNKIIQDTPDCRNYFFQKPNGGSEPWYVFEHSAEAVISAIAAPGRPFSAWRNKHVAGSEEQSRPFRNSIAQHQSGLWVLMELQWPSEKGSGSLMDEGTGHKQPHAHTDTHKQTPISPRANNDNVFWAALTIHPRRRDSRIWTA